MKKKLTEKVKRVIDMTSEELSELIRKEVRVINDDVRVSEAKESILLRGYKELASFLKCSVSTAQRKVACGDIHAPAIIRAGRTILFDTNLVLDQLREIESKWSLTHSLTV